MNFRFRKCCRRSGRASSRWNAPRKTGRRGAFWLPIDDPAAHRSADAEREVLWVLNGHCNSPIAGFSTIDGAQMSLTASVLDEAGGLFIEASRSGPADRPRELGRAVGLELLAKGAAEIIERSRPRCRTRLSPCIRPHPLQHLLDMRDRGFRLDAVAEIEDQPALRVIRQHVVDRAIERGAAGDQRQRIEIALHRDAVLHALADQRRLGRPVDADGIDAGCLDISRQQRAGASGKADDLRIRHFLAHALDDAPGRLDRPAREFARRQHAGPGVENLQHVGAGLELPEQILDRILDQHVDDFRERLADGDRPSSAPAPDPACLVRPPCRSRPSTARRRSRSARSSDRVRGARGAAPHTPARVCRSRPAAPASRPSPAYPADRAAGLRRPRSAPSGRARRE